MHTFFRHLTSGIAKQLMKFEKMAVETDPPVNLVKEQQTLSGETVFGEQAPDKFLEGKEAELLKTEHCVEKSTDIKHPMPSSGSGWKLNVSLFRGSYVVVGISSLMGAVSQFTMA
ncbi:uncharacterized protein LOC110423772 [Herrania umbratica]|uniref:Uncharacterized protein LOC110423772 n=1 Tax=Herrania umbratica TaxID=108875 RepID=A0A6J1B3E7_9ROSI|nr:uncharacterized protein LOC110423772 [Herrania umbratica]